MLPFYYAMMESPIGTIRIKSTETSIHELIFTDEVAESDIHRPVVMQECLDQLDAYFSGKRKQFDLPINPLGTNYQLNIWDNIQRIPYGATISYQKFATQAAHDTHVRAAAAAIGQNKIAIVIPCHRIVGSHGELRGYAWGIERKKWLIEFESRNAGTYMKLF